MVPGEVQKPLSPIWEVQLSLLEAEIPIIPIHQPVCCTFAVLIILMAVLVAPKASADTSRGEKQVNSEGKLQLRK